MSTAHLLLILRVLDLVTAGLTMLPEVRREYNALTAKLREFAEEDRDPTPEEIEALVANTDALLARLHRARG